MRIPLAVLPAFVALSAACAAGSGESFPPCDPPGGATDLHFNADPATVTAIAYPGGPLPSPTTTPVETGFAISAHGTDGSRLDLSLVNFSATQVQQTCVTTIHGSYVHGGVTLPAVQALVTVDSNPQHVDAKGRVIRAWFGSGASLAFTGEFGYEGPAIVP